MPDFDDTPVHPVPRARAVCGIRVRETIARRRLVLESSIFEVLNALGQIALFASVLQLIWYGTDFNTDTANSQVLTFVLTPIAAIFCGYGLYRVFTESRFQRTASPLGRLPNKKLVIKMLAHYGVQPKRVGREYIIAESAGGYPGFRSCVMMFIIDDAHILSNALSTSGLRGRLPSVIGPWLLKRDIRRACRNHQSINA